MRRRRKTPEQLHEEYLDRRADEARSSVSLHLPSPESDTSRRLFEILRGYPDPRPLASYAREDL